MWQGPDFPKPPYTRQHLGQHVAASILLILLVNKESFFCGQHVAYNFACTGTYIAELFNIHWATSCLFLEQHVSQKFIYSYVYVLYWSKASNGALAAIATQNSTLCKTQNKCWFQASGGTGVSYFVVPLLCRAYFREVAIQQHVAGNMLLETYCS